MEAENLIPIQEIITYHRIEYSFIHSLDELGLIRIVRVNDEVYLETEQMSKLEKMIRFHEELGINVEGIETITQLLKRIDRLNEELITLKNRLSLYE